MGLIHSESLRPSTVLDSLDELMGGKKMTANSWRLDPSRNHRGPDVGFQLHVEPEGTA